MDVKKLYNITECYSLLSVIIIGIRWSRVSGSDVSAGTFFPLSYPVRGDWLFSGFPPFTVLFGLVGGEEFLLGFAGFFTSRVLSCVG